MKNKHTVQRICVACRQIREKGDLIRLVRTPDGTLIIDMSAKKPGRGAYLCRKKDCWETALKKNRLEYALRTKLRNNERQILTEYGNNLTKENHI